MEGDFEGGQLLEREYREKTDGDKGSDWPVAPSSRRFKHVFDPRKIFSGRRDGGIDLW